MRTSRRLIGLIAVVFVSALGLGYATSSSGKADPLPVAIGSRAVELDVPAAVEQTGLDDTATLPAMARRPAPPPKPEPDPEPAPEPDTSTGSSEPAPSEPEPTFVEPAPTPAPRPPPAPAPDPPVAFDDEG